jgi:hypothetical protein
MDIAQEERKKAVEQLEKAIASITSKYHYDLVVATYAIGAAAGHIAQALNYERFDAGVAQAMSLRGGK